MLDLTSSISAVTVFRQGAQVERVVALPEGHKGPLRLTGLPLTLLDDSIALRVDGAGLRPVVVDFRLGVVVTTRTEESDLRTRLASARQERDRWLARQQTLQSLRNALDHLTPGERPHASDGTPVGAYELGAQLDLLEFREARAAELEQELDEVEKGLQKADEAVRFLEREELEKAQPARPESLEKALLIRLRGQVGAGVSITLQYRVPGARWAPAYSVAFSSRLDSAELTMRAMLAQRTGEDWNSVALTLSTADPNEWRAAPEWNSVRIGRHEPWTGPVWFPPPPGTELLFADFDTARARRRSATTTLHPAPPPPPPCPPKASSAPVMAQEVDLGSAAGGGGRSESGLGGERLEQAGPVLAAPMAPARMAAPGGTVRVDLIATEKKSRSAARSRQSEQAPPEEPEPLERVLTTDQRYRRFQGLRLLDFHSPRRGELVSLELYEEYRETFSVTLSESQIGGLVASASWAARQVDSGAAPQGYVFPAAQSGFDYSYQAQAPVDVVSDGAFHSVPVFVTPLEPKLSYVTVPRESQQVFRSASMSNPCGRALPEGPADISVGGDFLHSTPLREVTPDGVLRLGLGVEQGIKVSRNAEFKEGTSGLMGGTTELVHTITVEAVNHRGAEVRLEIQERLPQPAPHSKDEMKVVLGAVKPVWESFRPDDDPLLKTAYRWRLTLPPGEKVSASATYTIEIPSKYELQGGNRREPRS